jgi:hypothetical protein
LLLYTFNAESCVCVCVCCTQVRVYLSSMQDGLPAFKAVWDAWVDNGSVPVSEGCFLCWCVHCVSWVRVCALRL